MAAAGAVKDALATGGVDKVIITFFKNKLNFLLGPEQTYVLYARFFGYSSKFPLGFSIRES
jgi:hypothetical protein